MDTNYLHEALRNWQEKNGSSRTWDRLTMNEQSSIMLDAQDLKTSDKMSPEGRRNLEACEAILRLRRRSA
jgi:hypothetical protein